MLNIRFSGSWRLALLLGALRLNAQITLSGSIAHFPENAVPQLALEFWNSERWQQSEVVLLMPDHSFSQTLQQPFPGQYRLRLWGQAKTWEDFILSDHWPADSLLVFQLDASTMDGGPAQISGSRDNDAYFQLLTARRQLDGLLDSLGASDPVRAKTARNRYNRLCLDIATKNGKSLISDIANLFYEPQAEDYPNDPSVVKMTANAFVKSHAMDKIPFYREDILFHNAFMKALNRYCQYFDHSPEESRAIVDAVMGLRHGREGVDAFLFRYLLDYLIDHRNEDGLSHLLALYAPDCTEETPQPNSIQNLLEALKTCAPGNTAPEISMSDPNGQPLVLSEVCAKNTLTLLLFWRSTCSHCREFEPELAKIYAKYHPKGLEVYALSSDKTEQDWKDFLRQNPNDWQNVFIPTDQRKQISRQFPAPSTPTLIALDRNRRVVSRLIARTALEAFLDQELEPHKGK